MIETNVQEPLTTRDLVDGSEDNKAVALFAADEAHTLRSQWEKIQITFVDEPRQSVQQADELVATVIQRLAQIFADERGRLERDWGRRRERFDGGIAEWRLRRYRSLFDRL